jgi:hypothetical protein
MVFVPDQGPVEEVAPAGSYPPFHDRIHAWHAYTGDHDLDPRVVKDPVEQDGNFASRSRIRYLTWAPASSRSITRFRVAWVTQTAVGCAVVGEDTDPAGRVLDHGENVLTLPGQG